jgi:hypothetical protein
MQSINFLLIHDPNVKVLFGEMLEGRGGNLLPTVFLLGKGKTEAERNVNIDGKSTLDVVDHLCNLATQEAEAGRS